MTFPRAIDAHAFAAIEEASQKAEAEATRAGGKKWVLFQADMNAQELFLGMFAKTYSVSIALKASGASRSAYERWRQSSLYFAERFNEVIEQWNDSILQSAAIRARGVLREDPQSPSGFVEDASGAPMYFDADTRLTLKFLEAIHPGHFDDKVVIPVIPGDIAISENASAEECEVAYLRVIQGGKS